MSPKRGACGKSRPDTRGIEAAFLQRMNRFVMLSALALALSSVGLAGCAADVSQEDLYPQQASSDNALTQKEHGGCTESMMHAAAEACGSAVRWCIDTERDGHGSASCANGHKVSNYGADYVWTVSE